MALPPDILRSYIMPLMLNVTTVPSVKYLPFVSRNVAWYCVAFLYILTTSVQLTVDKIVTTDSTLWLSRVDNTLYTPLFNPNGILALPLTSVILVYEAPLITIVTDLSAKGLLL